ncbi:MAG: hypothetical protein WD801_01210, partial [Gemmatimonadaceae bacterium]
MRKSVLLLILSAAACGPPDRSRTRELPAQEAQVDRGAPVSTREAFVAPDSWERVVHPAGLHFLQPVGFTFGLQAARIQECDEHTPRADSPVLDRGFLELWPLTIAMRRGDVNEIARTNGFTLDSTKISVHEGGGDETTVRRGEGWLLLSGRADRTTVLFAANRAPGGCYLIWAARGSDLDPDTLGLVLSTLRFGAPPPPVP